MLGCTKCKKTFKTQGGLRRHVKRQHSEEEPVKILFETFECIISNTIMSLMDNKNYPESELLKIRQFFNVTACAESMYPKILPLVTDLYQSGNIDSFYKVYYMTFLLNASFYITDDLHTPISTLILKKIGERLVENIRKGEDVHNPFDVPITDKEMDVLQYLAAYVLQKLLKKFKRGNNSISALHQSIVSLLNMMTLKNKEEHVLIRIMDRGGLIAVRNEILEIFIVAEKVFRSQNMLKERSINSELLANKVSRQIDVFSNFSSIVDSGVNLEDEIIINLLEKMLSLYFRIRAFSTARDLTLKHNCVKRSTKGKGLRKHLKHVSEAGPSKV